MAKYIIEVDVDEKGAISGINKVESELKGLNNEAKKAADTQKQSFGLIEKVSPRAAGALRGVTGSVTGLSGAFKTLRAAIISTGIGALVVALGSLVAYFTRTQRGADLLAKAGAALGTITARLVDILSSLGEAMVKAFQDPQKAVKDLWEAIKQNFVNRIDGLKNQMVAFGQILKAAFTLDWDALKKGAEDYARSLIQVATGLDKDQQDELAKSIAGVAKEMTEAAKAAIELKDAEQKLRDETRQLSIDRAKANQQISEYRLIANDVTKATNERIEAARKAGELEQQIVEREVEAAKERLRIQKEQNALSESMAEDLDKEAQLEVELLQIQTRSNNLQKRLTLELNSIRRQADSERRTQEAEALKQRQKASEEFNKEELKRAKALAEEQKKIAADVNKVREFLASKRIQSEEEQINARYERLREQANGETELLKELEFQRQAELNQIRLDAANAEMEEQKKIKDAEIQNDKQLQDAKISFAQSTANTIMGIATALAGDNEANAKKIFAVNKALGIATATADTFRAANAVLADPTLVGFTRFAAMFTAISTGIANVTKIAATKFNSSGGGASSGGGSRPSFGGGNVTAQAQPSSPIDLGFLQENQTPAIQAYVISGQVQSQQEANTRVKDLTTL